MTSRNSKFKQALKRCQAAFSDFTEKDWKEFKKICRVKWNPKKAL